MYFPTGWPKVIRIPKLGQTCIKQISCNRDRILFAVLTDDALTIWFCKVSRTDVLRDNNDVNLQPCVPIVFYRRPPQSLEKFGTNILAEWKPDSSMIVVAVGCINRLFLLLICKVCRHPKVTCCYSNWGLSQTAKGCIYRQTVLMLICVEIVLSYLLKKSYPRYI